MKYMGNRRPVPPNIQTKILTQSARRCALCVWLYGDLSLKKGQIAHLDHDSNNNKEENLVFLCLDHHDEFDSKTSQSKGFLPAEVKEYRDRLYVTVATGLEKTVQLEESLHALQIEQERHDKIMEHDKNVFITANNFLSENHLDDFLLRLECQNAYRDTGINPILTCCDFLTGESHQFISPPIRHANEQFVTAIRALYQFLCKHFFMTEKFENDCIYRLYPDLIGDLKAGLSRHERQYADVQEQLLELCTDVRKDYQTYRQEVKMTLIL
ncbi:MAG: hypothetical protein GY797_04195 [Deltaproteobacteria bacterium]|nr:hypothetical protein [Deltaproteobacteria bacterium]